MTSPGVSRETDVLLGAYARLIHKWTHRINLVGRSSLEEIEARHIADCRQVADLIPDRAVTCADLGSGAGLPGLVIAICRPDVHVTCVESDRRKASFITQATRILSLEAEVVCARIEAVPPLGADIVTARALAPLPRLLGHVHRHLDPSGTALVMKGRKWQEELENARAAWHFSFEAASSRTDPKAVILSIGGLRPCLT
jgi:16S rRNA (guanine527-N7)-methyltransferase